MAGALTHMLGRASSVAVAAPTYVSTGSPTSNAAAITPTVPARQPDDIAILLVKTTNQTIGTDPTASGWTAINTPAGTGVAAAAGAVRLSAYWIRINISSLPSTVSCGDSGDMQAGVVMLFRGCIATGSPIDTTGTSVVSGATTALSVNGLTTAGPSRLVVACAALGAPDAAGSANVSGWTNADLTGLTEILDTTVTAGNGGGLAAAYGVKAAAGTVSATTATLASSAAQEVLSFALIPA